MQRQEASRLRYRFHTDGGRDGCEHAPARWPKQQGFAEMSGFGAPGHDAIGFGGKDEAGGGRDRETAKKISMTIRPPPQQGHGGRGSGDGMGSPVRVGDGVAGTASSSLARATLVL